jgi:hypothetical protein
LWGASDTAEETSTTEQVKEFLAATLYFHLHPRKALKAFDATGEVCTDAELAAFIRAQQRKVAGSSR